MSVRATSTVLRCDKTTPDPQHRSRELRCLTEFPHAGDFEATRSAAAQVGWARVRSSDPWCADIVLDMCPTCYPEMGR